MANNKEKRPPGELILYQGGGLNAPIQVRLDGETVWLSQKLMSELYDVAVPTINEHISNIYDDEELLPEATIRKFRIVQTEGAREVGRLIDHYNLEMIIAVGFRVRSRRGSQFRKWAVDRIGEYLVKGFTMDDERLKGNAERPNMGLTNWKGSRVLKTDVGTAKNYLEKQEIDTLNRITVMFLDQAEFRAQRRQTIRMADWEVFLDKFLVDVELPVLDNAGSISRDTALEFANKQYDRFADKRRLEAQQRMDQNYIDELKKTAETLNRRRKKGSGK